MNQLDLANVDLRALHVMWTLAQDGFEARLCGGAVRDLIMGVQPKDWDVATTARPEQVIASMETRKIHVIPTGLQHGTVTAVIDGEPIEITTLRIDQETDGRHATVEFTEDWKLDAQRRDFTMNALYLDHDGILHDYFGGVQDIKDGVVKFVGNPEDRIQEDYLRILRYFRFQAKRIQATAIKGPTSMAWQWNEVDMVTRNAIIKHREGLCHISGERVWSEIKNILGQSHAAEPVFRVMLAEGILDQIGMNKIRPRMHNLNAGAQWDKRPAVLLASMFGFDDVPLCVQLLRDVLHASNEEVRPVEFFVKNKKLAATRINAFRLLAQHPKEDVLAWIAIGHDEVTHVRTPMGNPNPVLYKEVLGLDIPAFPISGQDLMEQGIKPGPEMGKILKQLRYIWAELEFTPQRDYLIDLAYQTAGYIRDEP